MAKRTRGSRRDRRRARPTTFAAPAARLAAPVRAPDSAAAETGSPADTTAAPLPSSAPHSPTTVRSGSVLAARAADEYRYVTLDLRRIAVVIGSLFASMIVLWVLVDLAKVITL